VGIESRTGSEGCEIMLPVCISHFVYLGDRKDGNRRPFVISFSCLRLVAAKEISIAPKTKQNRSPVVFQPAPVMVPASRGSQRWRLISTLLLTFSGAVHPARSAPSRIFVGKRQPKLSLISVPLS
jgi:hypothetical protein